MSSSERAAWLVFALCAGCGHAGAKSAADAGSGSSGNGTIATAGDTCSARVRWVGRADTLDPTAARFAWSGSGFVATVAGTSLSVKLETQGSSEPIYFQPVIDGTPGKRFAVASGEQTVPLASGLAEGDHVVELYRETEGRYGTSVFHGFGDGTLKAPPAGPGRLLEIIGDSISAGYGNLGSEQHPSYGPDPSGGCLFSTETESAYHTYGASAARQLRADVSIVAVSGWGASRDSSNHSNAVLSSVYGNTLGLLAEPAWSFSPAADVVVINLGTNDFAKGDAGEQEFKAAYSALLDTVRAKYPDAWIFCMLGPMLYGTGLTQASQYTTTLVAERNNAGDAKVLLLSFGQQDSSLGTGCSYHPNVTVHEAMAEKLVRSIKGRLGW